MDQIYENIMEIAVDSADSAIQDYLLNNTLLAELPFLRIGVSIARTGKSYANHRLLRKLKAFLNGCHDLDKEAIEKFSARYARNEEKIGYLFLDELYGLNNDDKAQLAGKLFKYCLYNNIDLDTYHRILNSINNCYYDDILCLKVIKDDERYTNDGISIPHEVITGLYTAGLLTELGFDGGGFTDDEPGGTVYGLNTYGEILVELI